MPGSKDKILTIERITCTNKHSENNREIISVAGMPFYQSTGNNSAYTNTWFPFFGIQQNNAVGAYPRGWFIKSFETLLPEYITKKMDELFPSYGGLNAGRELQLRFWNIPSLLFSSTIGGCLWTTEKGAELKAFLAKQFPQYYQQMPQLEIKPSIQSMTEPEPINQWLCTKAGLDDYKKLTEPFPKTVDDFLKKVSALAKPIAPTFRPPIPMLRDPLRELPRYVGRILDEQELPKAPEKLTPSAMAPKPVQSKKVKLTKPEPKIAKQTKPEPKKAQPKRVRMASLDTQNGQRLFEARNQLRAKGQRPAPKRKDQEKPLQRFLKKHPEGKVATTPAPIAAKPERRFFSVLAFSLGVLTVAVYYACGFSSMMALGLGLICYVGTTALQFAPTQKEALVKAPSPKTATPNQTQDTATQVWLLSQNKAHKAVLQEPTRAPKSILKTRMGL